MPSERHSQSTGAWRGCTGSWVRRNLRSDVFFCLWRSTLIPQGRFSAQGVSQKKKNTKGTSSDIQQPDFAEDETVERSKHGTKFGPDSGLGGPVAASL